jgi:hypothetical protein
MSQTGGKRKFSRDVRDTSWRSERITDVSWKSGDSVTLGDSSELQVDYDFA